MRLIGSQRLRKIRMSKYIPCRKRQTGVLELEAYYNPHATFENYLRMYSGLHLLDVKEYTYTSKDKRRIWRRRPPEWIARWKLLYVRKLKVKIAIRERLAVKRTKEVFEDLISRPCPLLNKIGKDTSWKGKKFTLPIK